MKGRWIQYLPEELAWIQANAGRPRAELHAAFCFRFGRRDVSLDAIKALCSRRGWKSETDTKFQKGQAAHNKGKAMPFNPNSAATRFKAGTAPPNRVPLGTRRIGKDGYVEIKVPVPNPYTGHSTRFMHEHRWNWEQANGPLPKGHALKCLDGNRQNCAAENWVAVPRNLLPRLAGRWSQPYDTAPPEVRPALLATAHLAHAVNKIRREGST